jgi:thiol:disulfide interchange protein DsbD
VLTTLYLLGQFKLTHDSPVERLGALRLTWTMLCLAMTFYLLTGLFGRQLGEIESFLPPETANDSQANGTSRDGTGELSWILNDYEGALTKAKQDEKRVFIDFTGYTCTNCRWMEANMFSRPEVQKGLERFVRVRLYTDGAGKIFEDQQRMQQKMFGTVALPYYAVVDANGNSRATFPGLTRNAADFNSFLVKGSE